MSLADHHLDINCDVAEGVGNEARLFPYITSCNIAGGGHAGSLGEIRRVVRLALKEGVKIGAHPGYPDRENFGRKKMDMDAVALQESIRWQVGNVDRIARDEGATLHHIKPHGALYNELAKDKTLCEVFFQAILPFGKEIKIYAPPQSELANSAKLLGYEIVLEGFADRAYEEDLSLRSRAYDDALIQDKEEVLEHLKNMVLENAVITHDGKHVPIQVQTYCIHGDTPGAEDTLAYLSQKLPDYGIKLK